MGSDQQFSLRWNNYQAHISAAFEDLRTASEFVDVTLGCGGRKLEAHRMLLSVCSPYFKELLNDNICQHPIIILRDVSFVDMEAILKFIYNGEVKVEQDHLSSFLKTADSLKIRGLTDESGDGVFSNGDHSVLSRSESIKKRKSSNSGDASVKRQKSLVKEDVNENLVAANLKQSATPNGGHLENNLKQEVVDLIEESEAVQEYSDQVSDDRIYERSHSSEAFLSFQAPSAVEMMTSPGLSSESRDDLDIDWESNYHEYDLGQLRRSQGEGWHKCELCTKQFKSRKSLVNHQHQHKGRTFCTSCQRHFSTVSNLKTHLKNYHNNFELWTDTNKS